MSRLEKVLDVCGEYDLHFTEDYSGRGMYGTTCVGVEGDSYNVDGATGELRKILGDNRQDAMGLGKIIYWPRVSMQVLKEEDENGSH